MTLLSILKSLPSSLTVEDALAEATRLQREAQLVKDRVSKKAYKQAHKNDEHFKEMKKINNKNYYERKKLKLQEGEKSPATTS